MLNERLHVKFSADTLFYFNLARVFEGNFGCQIQFLVGRNRMASLEILDRPNDKLELPTKHHGQKPATTYPTAFSELEKFGAKPVREALVVEGNLAELFSTCSHS